MIGAPSLTVKSADFTPLLLAPETQSQKSLDSRVIEDIQGDPTRLFGDVRSGKINLHTM